jgi:4-hydroxy-3-polyprenylbenzoate decarboxylase
MGYRDLQDFLSRLGERNLLHRIKSEVNQDLEITEIATRTVKSSGPALLFENVKGHKIPVAINLFGSMERTALALGVENIEEVSRKLKQFLSIATEPKTGGFVEKIKAIPMFLEAASFLPKVTSDGVCKEVVIKEPSLEMFPILGCWPEDGGRFITFPLVFTKDPESGKRNCGIYRMQVFDSKTTGMHFHPHKDGARHLRKAKERLEVAVAIGSDPAVCFSGAVPLPQDFDEMILAGLIREDGVKMVKCETVDMEVPANTEIVLEGYIDPNEKRLEGPFGDHTGFYSLPDEFPVFHLTCVTCRKNPIYHAIVVGPPPQEDYFIGKAIERLFLPIVKLQLPEIVDYHMPAEGVFHNLMIVSIKKEYPGHARKVMHAIWGLGQMMFTKVIVVVDGDVDVHNISEVTWKVLNHIDPERDMEFSSGPLDILDHASRLPGFGSKVGIDGTRKWKEEGFNRPWPAEVKMSPDVKVIVDKKWEELGIKGNTDM